MTLSNIYTVLGSIQKIISQTSIIVVLTPHALEISGTAM